MDTPLAARRGFPAEVLHRVGQIHVRPREPGIAERAVEHPPGRTDKRRPLTVLDIAGLLADEDYLRGAAASSEHDLGRVLVQLAGAALARRVSEPDEAAGLGHRRRTGHADGVPAPATRRNR